MSEISKTHKQRLSDAHEKAMATYCSNFEPLQRVLVVLLCKNLAEASEVDATATDAAVKVYQEIQTVINQCVAEHNELANHN